MSELPLERILADKKSVVGETAIDTEYHDDGDWISIHSFQGQYATRFMIRECTYTEGNLLQFYFNHYQTQCGVVRVIPEKESIHRRRCFIVEFESSSVLRKTTPLQLLRQAIQYYLGIFSMVNSFKNK